MRDKGKEKEQQQLGSASNEDVSSTGVCVRVHECSKLLMLMISYASSNTSPVALPPLPDVADQSATTLRLTLVITTSHVSFRLPWLFH